MTGRSQSVNNWGKAARGIFLLPQAPLNPGPGPRVFQRRGSPGEQSPAFIIDAFRAGIDWTEDSAVGKGLDGSFSPGHSPAGFLLLGQRSDSLPFGKSGPYPISLTQMSQVSGQATAEPVRVTMPSLKTGLLAPSTAQVGEASCASFLTWGPGPWGAQVSCWPSGLQR